MRLWVVFLGILAQSQSALDLSNDKSTNQLFFAWAKRKSEACYDELRLRPARLGWESWAERVVDKPEELFELREESRLCEEDSLNFNALFATGMRAVHHDRDWTEGLTARITLRLEQSNTFRSELSLEGNYDFDPEKVDPDREPFWMRNDWQNSITLKHNKSYKIDWDLDASFTDNTVSSVEKSLTLSTGPSITFPLGSSGHHQLTLGAGVFAQWLEFDDDVPASRGFGRSQLQREISGPYCSVEFLSRLGEGSELGVRGRVLWDFEEETVREIPLALVYQQQLTGLARFLCGRRLVVEAGGRFYEDYGLTGQDQEWFAAILFER